MCDVPERVTQDRSKVCNIISEMLDHPDEYGIYPTTKACNQLERLLQKVRFEAIGWAWMDACLQLDNGRDPRRYEQSQLVERASKDLNPPWTPANTSMNEEEDECMTKTP